MDDYLAISALQHYAYCPRQFALIHVEQVWEDNRFTAEGQLLHQRVDSGDMETRGELRYERGVHLRSERLGIRGRMDLLEIELNTPEQYRPVEYKRGKPKAEDWDRIQVCAQALCLEEMRNVDIHSGAIWYWEVRRREVVAIDGALRQSTKTAIDRARELLYEGTTPAPINEKARCRACSLNHICMPQKFQQDWSKAYVSGIGE